MKSGAVQVVIEKVQRRKKVTTAELTTAKSNYDDGQWHTINVCRPQKKSKARYAS